MQPPIGSTFARERLAERQRAHPPLIGTDRIAQLYPLLDPHMPEAFRELIGGGHVAMGEVGEMRPILRAERLHGDWVIEMSSGLMQFIYAISRSVAGATRTPVTVKMDPRAVRDAHAKDITMDFREWKRDVFEGDGKRSSPPRALAREAVARAEELTTMAEAFLLAREIGRVLRDITPRTSPDPAQPRDEGFDTLVCDTVGSTLFFGAVFAERANVYAAYAGAILALRCSAGLALLGSVPPSGATTCKRIAHVEAALADVLSGDEAAVIAFTSRGATLDDLLERTEVELGGEATPVEQLSGPLAARCFDMLARHAEGAIDAKQLRAHAAAATGGVPDEVLAEAAEFLELALGDEKLQRPGRIVTMREARDRLAKELALPGARVFGRPILEEA